MAKLEVILTADEIRREIPYMLICETKESSVWSTGRRRRKWNAEFTEEERKSASRLFTLAYKWALKTGVPDKVRMSLSTYALWGRLAAFCASI